MKQYLEDVKFAVETIIATVWEEYKQIEQLNREIAGLERLIRFNQNRALSLMHSEDIDDFLLGIQGHYESYFGEEKDSFYKQRDLESLKVSFETKKFSINCLASTLLQIAKQGITTTHPAKSLQDSFDKCNAGRMIGTQPLKTVIRQARNQSMHYDEPEGFTKWLVSCFDCLTEDFGTQFSDYRNANKAFEVVRVLNWRTYGDFEKDMLSLS